MPKVYSLKEQMRCSNNSKKISELIIKKMNEQSIDVDYLAHKLNKSTEDIKHILSGKYNFNVKDLIKIEKILDINILTLK
jgi:ribosome-binding protein aMBF1 (putative translation factor)